ncbi:MAG: YraN family protein [Deltaproteobacteria bacterium]|nr:YraN family protein [Deltaproteobacteria bacterium]
MERQSLGRRGEDLAAAFLKKKGMKLVDKNVRTRYGELDLILLDGKEIVFTEVKTRSGPVEINPRLSIGLEKRRRLSKSALDFLNVKGWQNRTARFDVVCIVMEGTKPQFDYLIDAFDLTMD